MTKRTYNKDIDYINILRRYEYARACGLVGKRFLADVIAPEYNITLESAIKYVQRGKDIRKKQTREKKNKQNILKAV